MHRIRASHLLVAAIALGLMAFASSRLLPGGGRVNLTLRVAC